MTDNSDKPNPHPARAQTQAQAADALSDYYAQRAPAYEDVYKKPERQGDLALLRSRLAATFKGRRVLDVACGTGYFTAGYAAQALAVCGIDSSEQVLAVARAKLMPNTELLLDDAYLLAGVADRYDAALVSFWWSHVPAARRSAFFERLHQCLVPGARVVLIDNRYVPGNSTPIALVDASGDQWQDRAREDGTRQLVMKNYPTRTLLLDSIPRVSSTHWWQLEYYWWLDYLRP